MALVYASIPSKKQWLSDSSVTLAVRTNDPVLHHIDMLLEHYDRQRYEPNSSVVACDLFFTLDYWLKIYRGNSKMEKGRAPAVQALYECVAKELCAIFKCTINVLPRELELMFGREMSDVGVKVDVLETHGWKAFYAERSELPLFKLYFKNGRAYQYQWWTKPPGARVLAESRRAYSPEAGAGDVGDNYGFFVMSMGRDIYMMKHGQIGKSRYRIFHSSYLAGGTTMAAGSMLIEQGEVKRIRSDSGHYKPTPSNMISLLQALQMVGVNLSQVDMEDFNGRAVGKAPAFLDMNARWDLLLQRRDKTLDDNKYAAAYKPRQPGQPEPQPEPSLYSGEYTRTPNEGYARTPNEYAKSPR
jgi:hypothetical protein